jgi:hypothetical protein
LDAERIAPLLHRLAALLDQSNIGADSCFAELKAAIGPGDWSPHIDALEEQLGRLDWEASRRTLGRLIDALPIDTGLHH